MMHVWCIKIFYLYLCIFDILYEKLLHKQCVGLDRDNTRIILGILLSIAVKSLQKTSINVFPEDKQAFNFSNVYHKTSEE